MTRTLLLKSSSRSTNIIEKYLDDVNHYEWNTCDLLEELVKFIEIVNDESDLHLFKKLYIKALDQIIMKTDNESRRKRAADIKTAIDQVLKHSTFLKILTDSSRVNKRTRSSLTPSTSTSTHIEKKKLKRRMSFNIGPIMDNACCNIATAMNKKKLLFLYLKKPKEILNADWRTVQNYIMKHARPVCLSIEEQNALNYIRKCRTLDELTKCRHDLFDPNQKSDGVCYIRGALDRMIELTRTRKLEEEKPLREEYYRINVLSQLHDLSFLYCKELDSRRFVCRPLHQSTNLHDINRVDGIITSNNTHDLLFIEEKPPGSGPYNFTQDNIKCEKLRLDNLRSILKAIKSTKLHRHVEILSMNVNGYNVTLRGTHKIEYVNDNKVKHFYLHYERWNWTIPTSLSDEKSIDQLVRCLTSMMKLKGVLEHNKKKLDLIIEGERNNTDEEKTLRILHEMDSGLKSLSNV